MSGCQATQGRSLRVLLVDADENVGRWIGLLIDQTVGFEYSGLCLSPNELLPAVLDTRPDLIIMDLNGANKADISPNEIKRAVPGLKIFLTDNVDGGRVYQDLARRLSANGFMSKNNIQESLTRLCTAVDSGSEEVDDG
ncbi:MAG: hypothetical protein JRC92_09175 [Deltaproteobacteria bacterium]|nr:hypothetical protein [Deltaproteobacteria bacterium]